MNADVRPMLRCHTMAQLPLGAVQETLKEVSQTLPMLTPVGAPGKVKMLAVDPE